VENIQLSHQATTIDPPSLREITFQINAVNGINLGQGVCQLPVPPLVLDSAKKALENGVNRYTNPRGLNSIRSAVAKKLAKHNNIAANPDTEILITNGSTGGFEGICAALLCPGDEVVSFSPFYPYHHNTLNRFQAKVNYVELSGSEFEFSDEDLEKAFSSKTKFVLVNTPGNPTGKVFSKEELSKVARLCEKYDCLVVTDEIYEYMAFDGRTHLSPASLPELSDRCITIGGYSKTFAITGWRIGFIVLPEKLASVVTSLLDSIYICAPAPLQQAVADGIDQLGENFYKDLNRQYEHKRDMFCEALPKSGLKPVKPQGSYYLVADYGDAFGDIPSPKFVDNMIQKVRVAAVPATDFVTDASGQNWVRFCLSVEDAILEQALEQLKGLA
jgi:aminotransferase